MTEPRSCSDCGAEHTEDDPRCPACRDGWCGSCGLELERGQIKCSICDAEDREADAADRANDARRDND